MNTYKSHVEKSECPIAHALDVIGDRWTLIIIREMMFMGKHEFGEFLEAPEKISTNILADRLKKLSSLGIIDFIEHPQNKTKKLYYLTDIGVGLIDVMVEVILWVDKYLSTAPSPIIENIKNHTPEFIEKTKKNIQSWNEKNL